MLSLGLIISLYWEKTLLCTLPSSPCHLRFSNLASENEHYSQLYVIPGYYYLWSFLVVLYLTLGSFFTVYADQYPFECYRKTFCRPLEFSLCVALLWYFTCQLSLHWPACTPSFISSPQGEPWVCLGVISLAVAWQLSGQYSRAITGLLSFVSIFQGSLSFVTLCVLATFSSKSVFGCVS